MYVTLFVSCVSIANRQGSLFVHLFLKEGQQFERIMSKKSSNKKSVNVAFIGRLSAVILLHYRHSRWL